MNIQVNLHIMQQMRKIKAERAYLKSSTKKSSEAET